MGNAKFYFYPQPNGARLIEIDLGERLGELFFDFDIQEETVTSAAGGMYRALTMSRQVITIQRDRLKLGEDMANRLRAMESHLNRGYAISFCSDADRAFCYPISNFPYTGDTSFNVLGDPFRNMTGNKLPSVNDYLAIETPNLAATYEVAKYQSATGPFTAVNGGTMNISNGVNFTYSRPAFARYYRFWPCLRRAGNVGESIITNENGILFSLSLQLVVDTATLFSFHPLMQGSESTIDFDLKPSGEVVPREVAFGESGGSFGFVNNGTIQNNHEEFTRFDEFPQQE